MDLEIASVNERKSFAMRNVHVVPQFHIEDKFKQNNLNFSEYPHLRNLHPDKAAIDVDSISVLI